MSITLLNHSFLLIYSVINMLDQRIIVCRKTTCHCSTSTIEFIVMKIHRRVHGMWYSRVLCQTVCTRIIQWAITIRHCVWYERNIVESVVLDTQLPVIIDIGWIEVCITSPTLIVRHIRQGRTILIINKTINKTLQSGYVWMEIVWTWSPTKSIDCPVLIFTIKIPPFFLDIECHILALNHHRNNGKHFHHLTANSLDELQKCIVSSRRW